MLGEPMAVGYLPDQFGHTAQMPQLLRLRGIEKAVVWRGVPADQVGGVFDWEALDGSSVRTVHLQRSYAHGRRLPLAARELADRLAGETRPPPGPRLGMAVHHYQPVPTGLSAVL